MKKLEILTKIEPILYQKTYKEVSLQEIANVLEIKKSGLYYYFDSKEALYLEILEYSFEKYHWFIQQIMKNWKDDNFLELLEKFINYTKTEKNVFSQVSGLGYFEEKNILAFIKEHQKIIFSEIHTIFSKEKWFSEEKTFLFLTLITDIFHKKSMYGDCKIDEKKIGKTIEELFFPEAP